MKYQVAILLFIFFTNFYTLRADQRCMSFINNLFTENKHDTSSKYIAFLTVTRIIIKTGFSQKAF